MASLPQPLFTQPPAPKPGTKHLPPKPGTKHRLAALWRAVSLAWWAYLRAWKFL